MTAEVLKEQGGFRLTLAQDEFAGEPDFEYASPLLRVNAAYGSGSPEASHVDGGRNRTRPPAEDARIEEAAEYLFDHYPADKALRVLERWLHLFGVTQVISYWSESYWYVTYDSASWRQATGAPEGSADLGDYKAWINGDVWGWSIEKRVTWHAALADYPDRTTWERTESAGGYYGYEYAKQEAEESFGELFRAAGEAVCLTRTARLTSQVVCTGEDGINHDTVREQTGEDA